VNEPPANPEEQQVRKRLVLVAGAVVLGGLGIAIPAIALASGGGDQAPTAPTSSTRPVPTTPAQAPVEVTPMPSAPVEVTPMPSAPVEVTPMPTAPVEVTPMPSPPETTRPAVPSTSPAPPSTTRVAPTPTSPASTAPATTQR
jgi:hypothetical protein